MKKQIINKKHAKIFLKLTLILSWIGGWFVKE